MATKITHTLRSIRDHTRWGRVFGVFVVLLALANYFIYLSYRHQTYARTSVNNHAVGQVPFDKLPERLRTLELLPETVTLTYKGQTTRLAPAELGLQADRQQLARALAENRHWLPMANFFIHHQTPLVMSVEPKTFQRAMAGLGQAYKQDAANASLVLRNNAFRVMPETNARSLDVSGSQARIVEALAAGRDQAELMMKSTPPKVTEASLQPQLKRLEAQRNTTVSLNFAGKTKRFTPGDIGSWFVPQAASPDAFSLDPVKVGYAVSDAGLELGANVTNSSEAAAAVQQAVTTNRSASIALTGRPLGKRTYHYCTAGRGVPAAEVAGMTGVIDRTLNAKRGWSLSNNITFTKSETVCDFTIWLAAPEQMTSFGAICDAFWSCAVRPNVIFNRDRWNSTSPAWQRSGGSLEDYRAMVINHEVGHWLGFDHSDCPVQGQAAPVMQQQSIDLQGCVFNPWPTATERTALKNYLGL